MTLDQPELFGDFFEVRTSLGDIPDKFDITEIPFFDGGIGTAFDNANKKIAKTRSLPPKVYYVYKEGHPLFPALPFIKNERTGVIYSITDTKHSYPIVSLNKKADVWWDVHKLVGHAFIKNPDPSRKYQIDHINEDNLEFCLEVIKVFGYARAAPHMVDFRPQNLRWVTNSENLRAMHRSKRLNSQTLET